MPSFNLLFLVAWISILPIFSTESFSIHKFTENRLHREPRYLQTAAIISTAWRSRRTTHLYSEKTPTSVSKSTTTNANKNGFSRTSATANLQGLPSCPGWKPGQLDQLTDWAVNDEPNRPIICEYEPDALWLWTRWRGTVLSLTKLSLVYNLAVGVSVDVLVREISDFSWPILANPPSDDALIQQLHGLNTLWGYLVTLTTFILTFFTAEAYRHWRSVYFTTRAIQGRVNDICMLLTVGAQPENERAQQLVADCTRLIKKSHSFFWAATPTVSDGLEDGGYDAPQRDLPTSSAKRQKQVRIAPLLLSPEGLAELVEMDELKPEERDALIHSRLPPSQYTYILLEWVGLYVMQGMEDGLLGRAGITNAGLQTNLLRQLTALRAEYFSIGDYLSGRMPLAYVQLVQVLVDCLVYLAPFSLYSEMGSLSIVLTGILTVFYKGLLELSKSFLDPFGVEGYPGQNIRVDVLVSELNFGAASRWIMAANSFQEASSSYRSNNKLLEDER